MFKPKAQITQTSDSLIVVAGNHFWKKSEIEYGSRSTINA
jgi:hypothetical protein